MTRRYSPEEDEYRRHKVRQRINGRNTCLGCLLLLVVVPVIAAVGIWQVAKTGAFADPKFKDRPARRVVTEGEVYILRSDGEQAVLFASDDDIADLLTAGVVREWLASGDPGKREAALAARPATADQMRQLATKVDRALKDGSILIVPNGLEVKVIKVTGEVTATVAVTGGGELPPPGLNVRKGNMYQVITAWLHPVAPATP